MQSQLPPLIPRDLLFGNPDRQSPALSPDGTRLAWLAPNPDKVQQLWVQTLGQNDAKILTADKSRPIRFFQWAKNNTTLLYLQDKAGDENFHIFGIDLPTGNVRDYTPIDGVNCYIQELSPKHPDTILLNMNARDRSLFDIYRLNLQNGALDLDTPNPGNVNGWDADHNLQVRLATIVTPDAGIELHYRPDSASPWKLFLKTGPQEILQSLAFSPDNQSIYLLSSLNRNTAAIVEKNLATGHEKILAANEQVDAGQVLFHPTLHHPQAVSFSPDRTLWQILDPDIQKDFTALQSLADGDFAIVSRTADDSTWIIVYYSDRAPARYYQWNRKTQTGEFLFASRPELEKLPLAPMKPITITTRDHLAMHAYLTLPLNIPAKNLPMVLVPHGGPWARDIWRFSPQTQWLANRGYAVLQPNFRGSTGYGKNFLNAGDKQWGRKMHDDLIDAVNYAINNGIADPKRIAILGGSYGGYCALAAVTFTPDVFACAVDIVGPSSLKTLVETIPPYWKTMRALFDVRMGNIDNPADADLLHNASPLNFAHKIIRPLLIAQGANDPRVKQSESEQIVAAIQKSGGSVTYILYPDEGHGFARPENNTDFCARAEAFLAQHLQARHEPLTGEKIPNSTAIIREISPAK